jgi:ubiquinone/menaquinone biosynthesis C-methylase UbiE
MTEQRVRFDDGAAYEQVMGIWSKLAGEVFLDWLAPPRGLRWVDIGCGNGAFTDLLFERCAASEVQGVDPSEAQLAFARTRAGSRRATFHQGDAMALPFPARSADAAVMALVIVFVPDPAKGVAEMVRVVGPGGIVATYVWDMLDGGFPLAPILQEMRAMGLSPPGPPRTEACRQDALRALWTGAGLEAVEVRDITVSRTFADFEEFWTINSKSGSIGTLIAAMTPEDAAALKERVRKRLPSDASGRLTYSALANAVKGRVPA